MSGYWSIVNVENCEELWVDVKPTNGFTLAPGRESEDGRRQELDPVTTTIIWILPFICVEEITADNLDGIFLRVRMLEIAKGPFLIENGEGVYLTLQDLQRRIGLRAVADLEINPFEENILAALQSRANEALEREKESS
jgi:hypothetical protein